MELVFALYGSSDCKYLENSTSQHYMSITFDRAYIENGKSQCDMSIRA